MPVAVRAYDPARDERWATTFLDEQLGGHHQARGGEVIDVLGPGLGIVAAGESGLLTYAVDGDSLELTAVAAYPRRGVGCQAKPPCARLLVTWSGRRPSIDVSGRGNVPPGRGIRVEHDLPVATQPKTRLRVASGGGATAGPEPPVR